METKEVFPNNNGFSLVEMVVAVAITIVLATMGTAGYSSFQKTTKQAIVDNAADIVYNKAYTYLIDNNPKTNPNSIDEEYNESSENVVTEVEVLSSERIKVTATLDEAAFVSVKETPLKKDDNTDIDTGDNSTGVIIPSNPYKTVMTFICDSDTTGFLPIINTPVDAEIILLNASTGDEIFVDSLSNTKEYRMPGRYFTPKSILSSVSMSSGVEYKLTVEAKVEEVDSPKNTAETFAISSIETGVISSCLTSLDNVGEGIAGIHLVEAKKLTSVPVMIPSTITLLNGAFYNASIFDQDISSWNVASVTDMSNMFYGASLFNNGGQPLDWGDKTKNVTSMAQMFNKAKAFNQDISSWDMSNVNSIDRMFYEAKVFDQDISSWDISKVTEMVKIFYGAKAFNNGDQPLDWGDKTKNVKDISHMFWQASAFNQDVSSWDVSKVTKMNNTFGAAVSFNNGGESLKSWDTSNVKDMGGMFNSASAFDQPIEDWDTSNVIDMSGMFSSASKFNQPIGKWNVSNATNLSSMFAHTKSFDQDLSDWEVSNVTNMYRMFFEAAAFDNGGEALDWGEKTKNVKNMSEMFSRRSGSLYVNPIFNQDISSWNVSNVTNMYRMFYGNGVFNNGGQPLHWGDKTKNVTNMSQMFYNAKLFNQDISGWKVPMIIAKPDSFDMGSGIEGKTEYHPVWGK